MTEYLFSLHILIFADSKFIFGTLSRNHIGDKSPILKLVSM
jgi:hypothetical protein